ncbi:cytochrome P450 [Rhexocercosporidium sp. MPI-PUGE-AT-0058]|nr:cytochrome P450 [Rhexocercosporidium sp. MPI-PUGE-AT-0058]
MALSNLRVVISWVPIFVICRQIKTYLAIAILIVLLSAHILQSRIVVVSVHLAPILWLAIVSRYVYWFVNRRLLYRKQSSLPHSFFLGHVGVLSKTKRSLPPDVHIQVLISILADTYDLRRQGVFYLDLYPIQTEPFMVLIRPETIQQATVSLPKHSVAYSKYTPVIGKETLVVADGQKWKELRARFSPNFSHSAVLNFRNEMIYEAELFVDKLNDIVSSGGFISSMDELVVDPLSNIIGHIVLGEQLRSPSSSDDVVSSLQIASQLIHGSTTSISLTNLNPRHQLRVRHFANKSTEQIRDKVFNRWHSIMSHSEKAISSNNDHKMSLVEHVLIDNAQRYGALSADTVEMLVENVKSLIFAGLDTSSTVFCYVLFELSRHPKSLELLRKEHDQIFGRDVENAAEKLRSNPKLESEMTFTLAVIKETMRLYTPVGSTRMGKPGFDIVYDFEGTRHFFPTEGSMVYLAGPALHRDPTIFPEPSEFHPERFLPIRHSRFPVIPKHAYRPFERGPRTCLGQELAVSELKLLLLLVSRSFDFREAYEELDRNSNVPRPVEVDNLVSAGGRAYQVMYTTAKPKNGVPMWCSRRVNTEI